MPPNRKTEEKIHQKYSFWDTSLRPCCDQALHAALGVCRGARPLLNKLGSVGMQDPRHSVLQIMWSDECYKRRPAGRDQPAPHLSRAYGVDCRQPRCPILQNLPDKGCRTMEHNTHSLTQPEPSPCVHHSKQNHLLQCNCQTGLLPTNNLPWEMSHFKFGRWKQWH